MRARRIVGLALAAALALSCGRNVAAPVVPPVVPQPSRIDAVFPLARSFGVLYDTAIWVQFATPLDTATVSDRTVFFKADTQRLPATLSWDPATRRLGIAPRDRLGLRKTYTIELSAALRFEDGSPLGVLYVWQFTTNSLRRPSGPLPIDGKLEQSPFVALRWSGTTELSAGTISYEIHAGADSAAATDPGSPSWGSTPAPPFVPRARWRQDGVNYWAVHAINGSTGERLVGPVWRFTTFPANAAYDSIPVAFIDWNWINASSQGTQNCNADQFSIGPTTMSTMRWSLGPPDTTVRLVGAAIHLSPRNLSTPVEAGPSVWETNANFAGCALGYPGPPSTNEQTGKLADAVVVSPTRLRFSSDALTAHVEATRRLGGRFGYMFRSPTLRAYWGGGSGTEELRATLWLYRYRPPPGPPGPAPLAAARGGG